MFSVALFVTICIFFAIFGYFLPTFIAILRKKKNALPIFLVNLFFGMTFIGWICALIWALMYEDKDYR